MKDLNSDLFDPVTVMESEWAHGGGSTSDADFGFAFNDSNFSDRVLRIEIMPDPVDPQPDSELCTTIADWARHRKRRREDVKKENGIFFKLKIVFLILGFLGFLVMNAELFDSRFVEIFREEKDCYVKKNLKF
jgi:hypothetical protein